MGFLFLQFFPCYTDASFITRYLVTTFKVVPRGTEGAVSLEGTFAGLLAAIALAFVGYLLGDVIFFCCSCHTLNYTAALLLMNIPSCLIIVPCSFGAWLESSLKLRI